MSVLQSVSSKMRDRANNLLQSARKKLHNRANKAYTKCFCIKAQFCDTRGDFIEVAVKIIIALVIGALVLGGLYLLWQNVIMPRVNTEVGEMFDR